MDCTSGNLPLSSPVHDTLSRYISCRDWQTLRKQIRKCVSIHAMFTSCQLIIVGIPTFLSSSCRTGVSTPCMLLCSFWFLIGECQSRYHVFLLNLHFLRKLKEYWTKTSKTFSNTGNSKQHSVPTLVQKFSKNKLYNALGVSVLLYGIEIWTQLKGLKQLTSMGI